MGVGYKAGKSDTPVAFVFSRSEADSRSVERSQRPIFLQSQAMPLVLHYRPDLVRVSEAACEIFSTECWTSVGALCPR